MNERELSQALSAGLGGVSLFRWGWAALESDVQPPSLPLVTLTRTVANVDGLSEMCDQATDLVGETTVETHAWARVYEDARTLQDDVRAIIIGTGWRLLGEQDAYDTVFRSWRITAQWSSIGALNVSDGSGGGLAPDTSGHTALFIPLHLYTPPEPPPVRAFASGFDEGFA